MRFTTFFKAAAPYVAMALFVSLINPAVATAAAMDVELKASDGTALKATYRSPGRPGPAMLLIHQCNMDRSSWNELATALVDTGVHVLTMDLRGFGESEGEGLQAPEASRRSCRPRPPMLTWPTNTSSNNRAWTSQGSRLAAPVAARC